MNTPGRREPYQGRIVVYGVNEDDGADRAVSVGSRSSSDINDDIRCMNAALELRDAIRRGVNISHEVFYRQVVGATEPKSYCVMLNNCTCARDPMFEEMRANCNHWRSGQ